MDPNANWQEQQRIQARGAKTPADRERLRELRSALNEWLRNGGFPPRGVTR